MLRTMRWMFVTLLALSLAGCTVGHRITRLPGEIKAGDQAAYYALPRTVIHVSFPVSKTQAKKGTGKVSGGMSCYDELGKEAKFPLANGAAGFADITSDGRPIQLWQAVGLENSQPSLDATFKVTSTPTISALPEPDPDQIFRVDLDSSWAKKRQIKLMYGPLGVLESGTSFVQDRRVDLSVALVKGALSVVSSGFSLSRLVAPAPARPAAEKRLDCRQQPDPCQRAACEIYEARRLLYELPERVGTPGLDSKQADWLAKRYRDDIDRGVAVFIKVTTQKANVVCAARPASSPDSFEVLHFEATKGFWQGNGAECLIPNGFRHSGAVPSSWVQYDLDVSTVSGQYSETLTTAGVPKAHDEKKEQGFYYRVPAVASVQLREATEVLTETQLVVAQLGFVAALPRQRTYQSDYQVTLDPATGALKTLSANSDSIDPALITSSGEAIAGAVEARAEARKEEAAAKDELAILERERKILEETKKIKDLREELGETEPPPP